MLWYKGWLEMRWRIVFTLGFAVFPIFLFAVVKEAVHVPPPEDWLANAKGVVGFWAFYYSMAPAVLLAGSGIKTQQLQARRGLHGSMYFTLSLPVSRLRLLATRAGVGFLASAGILAIAPCAVWLTFPRLRPLVTGQDWLAYWVTLAVCSSAFYFMGVLLSTFLGDFAQNVTSMLALLALYGILFAAPLPAPVNIFRAMGAASPLFTHSFPWASMGIALGAAGILFLTSLRVLQEHEY